MVRALFALVALVVVVGLVLVASTGWLGAEHGPFDLTLIKIGAYGETWPDIHLTPEQAVDAHMKLRGDVLLPIHWGTFNLAFHAWDEPAERVVVAATAGGTRLVMPRPAESIEPATAPAVQPWWHAVRKLRDGR